MQLKTILNRVQKFKSFVYQEVRWASDSDEPAIEVEIVPRRGSRARCSGCGELAPGYDRLTERRYEFIPLWGILVYFLYAARRVDCRTCGVVVELLPWVRGKHRITDTYAWYLSRWARRLSWKEVAEAFHTSWDHVYRSVERAVRWGLARRDLDSVTAIGIDEIQWQKGHKYLTLVYQIDEGDKRLLWVGRDRKVKTLLRFFAEFGDKRSAAIRFVCSDMWKPYLKVIARKASQALHILDRYHVMANMNKAIDKVRAEEARALKAKGQQPVLKKSRWLFLKRPENLTEKQAEKLSDLVKINLRTVRAYLLKEDFQRFWEYVSPFWAGKFLDAWCTRTMRSKIDPMKKMARQLREHRSLLMNWFRAKGALSNGVVEGFNNKAKLTTRKAYGFRTYEAAEIALYHALGNLPEPEGAHRFF